MGRFRVWFLVLWFGFRVFILSCFLLGFRARTSYLSFIFYFLIVSLEGKVLVFGSIVWFWL